MKDGLQPDLKCVAMDIKGENPFQTLYPRKQLQCVYGGLC